MICDFKLKLLSMSCLWAVIEQMIISTNQLLTKWYGIKEFAQNEYVKENIEFEFFLVKAL